MCSSNNYADYKQVRDAAWQTLIDTGVSSLPVSVAQIAQHMGVVVSQYKEQSRQLNLCGYTEPFESTYHVYYDPAIGSRGRVRFTIAHELGHILLNHFADGRSFVSRVNAGDLYLLSKSQEERAADMFAIRLLAPVCVLWALGITSVDEVQQTCQISRQAAQYRADRMQVLAVRNMFLSHPLERQVYRQFLLFITENRK